MRRGSLPNLMYLNDTTNGRGLHTKAHLSNQNGQGNKGCLLLSRRLTHNKNPDGAFFIQMGMGEVI
jgi:hypothetical protein